MPQATRRHLAAYHLHVPGSPRCRMSAPQRPQGGFAPHPRHRGHGAVFCLWTCGGCDGRGGLFLGRRPCHRNSRDGSLLMFLLESGLSLAVFLLSYPPHVGLLCDLCGSSVAVAAGRHRHWLLVGSIEQNGRRERCLISKEFNLMHANC